MHWSYRNQIILAFWAPKLKITQLLLTFTMLRTFLSKCRIFTHVAAIYPVITNGTFFNKRFKRLKRKECIFISLPKTLIPATYTCYSLWLPLYMPVNARVYVMVYHLYKHMWCVYYHNINQNTENDQNKDNW